MGHQAAIPLVLVLAVLLLATGNKGGTLLALPVRLAWAVLRWLGFRPAHVPGLAVTALLVVQAIPTVGFRLPLVLAAVGWLVWLHRPGRGRGPRWLRRAQRKYAQALRDATRNLHRPPATPTAPARPVAAPKPATPTRPTPPTPTRPTTPTAARPASGPDPAAAQPSRARPAAPKPAASAPYWTPPPLGFEPVWPRWLGGGWLHKRRQTP